MVVMDFGVAPEKTSKEFERRKWEKVTFYKVLRGSCRLLSEWVCMGSQYLTSIFWRGVWRLEERGNNVPGSSFLNFQSLKYLDCLHEVQVI